MAKTLEQLAKEIMTEALEDGEPITEAEALEMAKMEVNAKENKDYYATTEEKKKTRQRERKVDETKKFILEHLKCVLDGMGENVTMENETDLHFEYGGDRYSLKLTKHRPPKK